jgi:hypothetical protein
MTTTTTPREPSSSSRESQKQVLIPIATGSDETEVLLLATTLQRFGALVVLAAVDEPSRQCGMVGGFLVTADIRMEEAHDYDWDCIVIPGGGQFVCVCCTIKKESFFVSLYLNLISSLPCYCYLF